MNPPIRLLHLSDIHFKAGKVWDQDPVLRALARFIAGEVKSGLIPDLVAITGDLAFAGTADDYGLAKDWLDQQLWPVLPADFPRDRLLLVPGNHDVDRNHVGKGAQSIQDSLLADESQDTIAAVLKRSDERDMLLKRHTAYLVFLGDWLGEPQSLPWWQRVIVIRGTRLHVAGLDSAWMAWQKKDRNNLLLGRYQLNQTVLTKDADDAVWRIALLHHPWDYLAEFDGHESRQTIHQHCDLLLRGHLHETDAFRIDPPDPSRACLELAAGCVYENSRYPNAFQWIELHTEPRRLRVHFRAWVKGAWTVDRNQPGCPAGEANFNLNLLKIDDIGDLDISDLHIDDSDKFIGRQKQICELEERLINNRLVTLVGLGGIGKTRLAKEIVKQKSERAARKEAIAFVSFEYVTSDSEGEVLDALVSHLKLAPANAQDRLPALVRKLSATTVLLVLDNCETARSSIARVVSRLLGRCRNLKILATSQHQLGCYSETVYRLPPLSVPDDSPVSLTDLEHLESYKLFLNRVQMVDEAWTPEKNNASRVPQLLQLTEGIPLAIEIVAAWAPVLSLSQICDELAEKPFGPIMEIDEYSIVESGRHQSMLRCFEWSLDHLTPNEAAVFKRLGVFEGRFPVAAADAVCEVDEPRKLLIHLVNKSLVHICPGTDPRRYKLLNFTRAFARKKAKAEGLDEQLSKRHLGYCLSLIQPSADEDSGQDEVVVSWEEDWPDLLAAAHAAPSIGNLQAVWRISRALGPFLQQRGLWFEREQLSRASVKAALEANYWVALGRSLIDLGIVLEAQGQWEDAAAQYRQCLYYANRNATRNLSHQASALEHLGKVLTRLGDHAGVKRAQGKLEEITRSLEPRTKARSLDTQGRVFQDQGELVKACTMYREAFHIREDIGDSEGLARSRMNLGNVLTLQRDWEAAEDELRKSLDYWTSENTAREQAIVMHLLADLFRRQRRLPEALDFCEKCLALREGDPKGMAVTKTLLAKILVAKKDYQPAIDALQESCKLCQSLGDTEGESISYDEIGAINTLRHRWGKALDAFESSRKLKESAGRRDIIGLGITWDRIAQVYALRREWVLAQEAYTKSLGYSREAGRKLDAAVTLMNVAMMHAAQGQKETTLKVLDDAIASLESQYAGTKVLQKAGKVRSRLYRKMHDGTPWTHWEDAAFENQSLFIRMRFESERKNKRWKEAASGYEYWAVEYSERGQQMEAGLALNELGSVYRHLMDPARSESAIRKALAIFEDIALPLGLARSWHKLGDLFAEQKQWPVAEDAYSKSIQLKHECLDDEGEAITQGALAEMLIKAGRLDEAENAVNRSWKVMSEIGTARQKWHALVGLLRIKVEQVDPTGAWGIADRLIEAVRGDRELEAAAGDLRAMVEAGNWDGVKARLACAGIAGASVSASITGLET